MCPTVLRIRFSSPQTEKHSNFSYNCVCIKLKNKSLLLLYNVVVEVPEVSLEWN